MNWDEEEERMLNGNLRWSGETLCLKKKAKEGEKAGIMGYSKYGVITKPGFPMEIYLRGESAEDDFKDLMVVNSLEEFCELGWMVD